MQQLAHRPERLDFLALRLVCRAQQGFALDNACSDLHGGFGLMLHAHFRPVYEELFGAQADSGAVRAYVLRPGAALFQPLASAASFTVELLLYGAAARHAPVCAEALGQLGHNGLTCHRHRFAVESVARFGPDGEQLLWSPAAGWNLGALRTSAAAEVLAAAPQAAAWRVELRTPLAIKHGNRLLRQELSAPVFFERLLGRAQLLATQQGGEPLLDRARKHALLQQAHRVHLLADRSHWVDASRYSARQRQRSEFGGLLGDFQLHGDSAEAMAELGAWLALAQWLHVGSKTSFGLGACFAAPLPAAGGMAGAECGA